MDESTKFSLLLSKVHDALPSEVLRACESLNGHGEWEMALGHCVYHLAGVPLSTKMELMACAKRFGSSDTVLTAIEKLPCS